MDDAGVHLQALEVEEMPRDLEPTKQALFQEVGVVQWPELLMAIDSGSVPKLLKFPSDFAIPVYPPIDTWKCAMRVL